MAYKKYFLFVILIFALKFAVLGIYDFHYPSEIRYATISMRMALTGNYLMPFFTPEIPFFGKPPLSFWASAISFKVFGFNEFAGRLPHLLALIAVCLFLYHAVKKIYESETAIVAVLIFCSFGLFYALHSVMTEAFLLLGMSITTLSFLLQIKSEKPKNIYGYLFFVGCAISMMTKGPVGIFMPCLPILFYIAYKARWRELFTKFPIISGSLIFICISLPWFLLAESKYPGFLKYFILGENFSRFSKSGWTGDLYGRAHYVYFGTIWWFFALSTFPAIFALAYNPREVLAALIQNNKKDDTFLFFIICCLVPLIFLTFMRNMIITYAIYSLLPFAVIIARLLIIKNWHKFIAAIGYITITLYALAIAIFIINPSYLAEKLNYQTYLIKHIPSEVRQQKDFKIYYLGVRKDAFGGYWLARDNVKIINQNDLVKIMDITPQGRVYVVGLTKEYNLLDKKHQQDLTKIVCATRDDVCLYVH